MKRNTITHNVALAAAAALVFATLSGVAQAESDPTATWKAFKSDDYGFSMKVPKTAKLAGATLPGKSEWAGLYGRHLNVHLWGITHKGVEHTPAEIASFGVKVSKIAAKHWVQIAKGKDTQGFKWYRVAVAQTKRKAVVAIYGVGPQGSYILFLAAPKWVYTKYKTSFHAWATSISVF